MKPRRKSWATELAVVKKLRSRVTDVQKKYAKLVTDRVRILKVGGPGWPSALARTNVAIERTWEQLRVALLRLYARGGVA